MSKQSKVVALVGALLLSAGTGSFAAKNKAALPLFSGDLRKSIGGTPTPCDADCTIEVWVYAPGQFTDPGTGAPVPTCAAVIQSSKIIVSKGKSGHKIRWQLINKTTGDNTAYRFDSTANDGGSDGIDLSGWSKKRYQSRDKDFTTPTLAQTVRPADTFSWVVVNSRRRDDGVCHDPSNTDEDPGHIGKPKCEIAYAAWVLDASSQYCASYDPTIINNGQ